jgi:hypothetical protein
MPFCIKAQGRRASRGCLALAQLTPATTIGLVAVRSGDWGGSISPAVVIPHADLVSAFREGSRVAAAADVADLS